MMEWLTEILYAFDLTWSKVLWGLGLYLVTFIGSTVVVAWLLIRLPATYFCDAYPEMSGAIGVQCCAGHASCSKTSWVSCWLCWEALMALPVIPRPGILMLVFGVMLWTFPVSDVWNSG